MVQSENGDEIKSQILKFYDKLAKDANHRYRSWEHCYAYFRKSGLGSEEEHDTASLHLAFYLASWGMYRGSSALLWKDYKIHIPVIAKLREQKYKSLWHLDSLDKNHDHNTCESIMKLVEEIAKIYQSQIKSVDGKEEDYKPSGALITKILLGTLGCTPARDRFFRIGFRPKSKYSAFNAEVL